MASNDIKSNTERIKTLGAIIKSLHSISSQMGDAQSYYDSSSDFAIKNDYIEDRMVNIGTLLTQAAAELTAMALAVNLKFQHEWVVGKHEIKNIVFTDGGGGVDTLELKTGLAADLGYALTDTFSSALATGDRVRISGTTSNDGEYVVVTANPNSFTVATASFVAEECVASGAKVTKVRDEV